jgi:cytochrome c2
MSKINSILIMIVCFFMSCSPSNNSESISKSGSNQVNETKLIFDIDSLLNKEKLDTIQIKLDWVTKKANKRYKGVSTKYLFSKLITNHKIDTTNKEVIFLCKDGYSARVPFYQLLTEKGYLVNKDVDARLQWDEEIDEKFTPCYLVWSIDKDENNFSFPYGIIQIKIVDIDEEYKDANPINGTQNVHKGFSIFKKQCIKCHPINKVGGVVGPELNTPMNVTEYWKIEHLESFILNPDKYRYNSKMPTIHDLSNNDVKLIIEYLKHMSKNKKF